MARMKFLCDSERCIECNACVTACKNEHEVPWGINRRRVVTLNDGQKGERSISMACMHCEDAPCVTVCPTGASYKRTEDGIVLVDEEKCIGCGLCAWACPYGAREMDLAAGVMKKCTLCIDRIYNETFEEVDRVPACVRTCPANARHFGDLADPSSAVSVMVAERGGMDLMPEQGTRPVNKYLPPRPRKKLSESAQMLPVAEDTADAKGFFAWLDGMLDRI